MKTPKRLLMAGFILAAQLTHAADEPSFVRLECNTFYDSYGQPFRPLAMNYIVQIREITSRDYEGAHANASQGDFYVSPCPNYSIMGSTESDPMMTGFMTGETGTWQYVPFGTSCGDSQYDYLDICEQKIRRDFRKLHDLGFNCLRLVGFTMKIQQGQVVLPTADAANYQRDPFVVYCQQLDKILSIMAEPDINLKAIILVSSEGGDADRQWSNQLAYNQFLQNLATYYANNTTVMAYDLFNEPSNGYKKKTGAGVHPEIEEYKHQTACWLESSYYIIKKYAPHHLVTIGDFGPETVFYWDPNNVPLDFISFHIYPPMLDATAISVYSFESQAYWVQAVSNKTWIVGETSYSGSDDEIFENANRHAYDSPYVGSDQDQQEYAQNTMQYSVNCGCQGYSWWSYNDAISNGDISSYWGIMGPYKALYDSQNNFTFERQKASAAEFAAYSGLTAGACDPPSYYNNYWAKYNIPG